MQIFTKARLPRSTTNTSVALATVFISGLLAGCNGDKAHDLLQVVEHGEIGLESVLPSTSEIVLSVGQDTTLSASGSFRDNGLQNLDNAAWKSLNPSVATVNANGEVTAIAEGSTSIVLTYQGTSGEATITVTEATLESIAVIPDSIELNECEIAEVSSHGVYSDGSSQILPTSVLLSVSDELLVSANRQAEYTVTDKPEDPQSDDTSVRATQIQLLSHDAGSANLTMSIGDVSTVLPIASLDTLTDIDIGGDVITLEPGNHIELSAAASYNDGTTNEISTTGQWSLVAEDGTDLTVTAFVLDSAQDHQTDTTTDSDTPATGESEPDETEQAAPFATLSSNPEGGQTVHTNSPGTATLTFSCGGLTQAAQVIIEYPPALASISIDASSTSDLVAGDSVTIEAQAILSNLNTGAFEEEIEWELSSENTGFALSSQIGNAVDITVSSETLIETTVDLLARSGEVTESLTLVANAGVTDSLQSLVLLHEDDLGNSIALPEGRVHTANVGDTLSLAVEGIYLSGQQQAPQSVQWVNASPTIATVDQDGIVHAVSEGSTFISVHVGDFQIHLPLMVTAAITESLNEPTTALTTE